MPERSLLPSHPDQPTIDSLQTDLMSLQQQAFILKDIGETVPIELKADIVETLSKLKDQLKGGRFADLINSDDFKI